MTETSALQMDHQREKEELKCAMIMCMGLSVMMAGDCLMHRLSADISTSQMQVPP